MEVKVGSLEDMCDLMCNNVIPEHTQIRLGDTCRVLEGCSRLEAGAVVIVLGHSKSAGAFWCQVKDGRACYWIKSELLEVVKK